MTSGGLACRAHYGKPGVTDARSGESTSTAGHAGHGEIPMPPRVLNESAPRGCSGKRSSTRMITSVRPEIRGEEADEELLRGYLPLAAGAARQDDPVIGERHGGPFRAGIGMGQAAAYGAAVADRHVPDLVTASRRAVRESSW